MLGQRHNLGLFGRKPGHDRNVLLLLGLESQFIAETVKKTRSSAAFDVLFATFEASNAAFHASSVTFHVSFATDHASSVT